MKNPLYGTQIGNAWNGAVGQYYPTTSPGQHTVPNWNQTVINQQTIAESLYRGMQGVMSISVELTVDVADGVQRALVIVGRERMSITFPINGELRRFTNLVWGMKHDTNRPMLACHEVLIAARNCGARVADEALDYYAGEAMAEEIRGG